MKKQKKRTIIELTVLAALVLLVSRYLFMGESIAEAATYRDFVIDNVYHSKNEGDIHYNVYIPESYDGSRG